ncbi:MAG: type II toxin-antitoxin system PemK/MazF family toxin [Campylobacterota bacterium]|nr:type II toxin-antitoxin system PemK/MazF family toxin [Campylobacterota bacterium]
MKQFNEWNELKKEVDNHKNKKVGFKTRDIFYMNMGENIGFEQNGKGKNFIRPIVVLKVFNREMFFAIPLSSQLKEGKFYYSFEFEKKDKILSKNVALLSQMKIFSSKRLLNKIGTMKIDDFENMKESFKCLLD